MAKYAGENSLKRFAKNIDEKYAKKDEFVLDRPENTAGSVVGYRLVFSQVFGTWSNSRLLLAICSRHQGNGILSIALQVDGSLNDASAEMVYFGSSLGLYSDYLKSWILTFNKTTGEMRLYWRHADYSNCKVKVLLSQNIDETKLGNGAWSDNYEEADITIFAPTI